MILDRHDEMRRVGCTGRDDHETRHAFISKCLDPTGELTPADAADAVRIKGEMEDAFGESILVTADELSEYCRGLDA